MNRLETQSTHHWLFAADRRRARILTVEKTPHGRVHVDERAHMDEAWDEREHGRPSPRRRDVGYSYASVGHETNERLRRFVKSVAAWLARELEVRGIRRIHAFAGPRFMGELRWALPPGLEGRFVEHTLDLGRLSPGDLEGHEAVIALDEAVDPESTARERNLDRSAVVRSMARDRDLKREIAYEHAAIRGSIADLRVEIDRLRGEPGPGHDAGRVYGMLQVFSHHLLRHFALEERGGLLDGDGHLDGDARRTVEELLAQHRQLERELERLLEGTRCAAEDRACLTDAFVQELRDFLTALAEHEQLENALVKQITGRLDGAPA